MVDFGLRSTEWWRWDSWFVHFRCYCGGIYSATAGYVPGAVRCMEHQRLSYKGPFHSPQNQAS